MFLVILLSIAYSSIAAPTGGNLSACVANACPDEPMTIMQLATSKAGELIDSFYQKRCKNDGFNGCVMVAKDGQPIYSAAFGYGNYIDKDTLTLHSSIQLASVSKTFTATAILLLVEQGVLSLDDSVQKFFPEFPYADITIRLLLSHRTGLPDYTVLGSDFYGVKPGYITNSQLMDLLATKKPAIRCKPDRMFIYCNTNYAILASIIERATGMSYKQFMYAAIFAPLGMSNTYVYDFTDSTQQGTVSYESRWKEWHEIPADGVVGDKGIYSSAEDMLKWDYALRTNQIISPEMQEEAYKPRSLDRYSFVKERDKNYGYGWRMVKKADKNNLIYHNGFWHGSNNVFARDLQDGYTVIVLGNKSNNNNYWTAPVWEVLNQLKTFENIAEAQ